ncbi:MAG: cobyrinic acid a,c-diamide synthase [Lautropia sp.]|nr:cobyrinic acid a,c-diamide synthase [Lautropia sp.]
MSSPDSRSEAASVSAFPVSVQDSPAACAQQGVRRVPAVLVSAPASGHGKTTVVAALARLLTRQGRRVRVFKYGPDFLDPGWHTMASGATVNNLDLWMTGEADIRQRLYEAAAEADLIIVEGVMGLYDGTPSAAELAQRLGMPVMAVIDAGKMVGTFGALAHGLATWMPGLRWAGALANRVASPRHAQLLADAIRQRPGALAETKGAAHKPLEHEGAVAKVASSLATPTPTPTPAAVPSSRAGGSGAGYAAPVQAGAAGGRDDDDDRRSGTFLGAVLRDERFGLPSRHLGLIAGSELPDALARLDAAADALVDTVLGQLDEARLVAWQTDFLPPDVALPSFEPGKLGSSWVMGVIQPLPALLAGRRIAVARDAAFSFIYPANLDTLQALGAELVFFSPLAGDSLPACDALWLPGGYPELHAEALGRCQTLAEQIRQHVAADKPVWAECGGMLPLFEQMSFEGQHWPMWGLLPGQIVFQSRVAGLGMQQLAWPQPQPNPDQLDRPLRGHTFHYSLCDTPLVPVARSSRPDQPVSPDKGEAVYRYRQLQASYFHAWFASNPWRAAALFLPAPETDEGDGG